MGKKFSVETTINLPVAKVWTMWTSSAHMSRWNRASGDWHTRKAQSHPRMTGVGGRKVKVSFFPENGKTKIVEIFEADDTNPAERWRKGWQAILDNFKKYAERNN
jgi:uncharacterized protein YndB with AHSA1/START domain